MSKWAGKYVIGLTGNIGTGKSVVRKMLEHLGAYGIDADALAHRAIARGAPGYEPVLQSFGRWLVMPDGEISRAKLGRLVFSDPEALKQLESIIHPLVSQAVDLLIRRAEQRVIVIEAIKLIEAGMNKDCDSLWVVYAPPEVQLARLIEKRKMSEAEARQRITAQSPQEQKLAVADVIIRNGNTFEDTWRQVSTFWKLTIPHQSLEAQPLLTKEKIVQDAISVMRGRPAHSTQIANLFKRLGGSGHPTTSEKVMEAFGEKAYLLLKMGNELVGVMGWQVENLVARTLDLLIAPQIPLERALPPLIQEMETASNELQCEVSLVFVPPALAKLGIWRTLGYEVRLPHALGVQAWQEAAQESFKPGMVMLFKQLRKDRVLRPI